MSLIYFLGITLLLGFGAVFLEKSEQTVGVMATFSAISALAFALCYFLFYFVEN